MRDAWERQFRKKPPAPGRVTVVTASQHGAFEEGRVVSIYIGLPVSERIGATACCLMVGT